MDQWFGRSNQTHPSTHQGRRLLKRNPIRQGHRRRRIRDNILGKSAVGRDARHILVVAESRVGLIGPQRIASHSAADAVVARVAKVKHTHALTDLPVPHGILPHGCNGSRGLVGWGHRRGRLVHPFVDLIVCVTESGCPNLDKQLVVANRGDGDFFQLVGCAILMPDMLVSGLNFER